MIIKGIDTVILGEDFATPIKDEKKQDLTVRHVMKQALLLDKQGEDSDPVQKFDRFLLAKQIHSANGELSIKAEDVALVKKRVAAWFAPLVVGQVYEVLEPPESPNEQ